MPVDRLTKAAIYAAAGVPEYWIVNLRDDVVEVLRDPEQTTRSCRTADRVGRGRRIALVSFPDAGVAVADLLPGR